MSNVKALQSTSDIVAEAVIAELEEALEFARENPQRCVSIFSIGRDDIRNHRHVGMGLTELVGSLEVAKVSILTAEE